MAEENWFAEWRRVAAELSKALADNRWMTGDRDHWKRRALEAESQRDRLADALGRVEERADA